MQNHSKRFKTHREQPTEARDEANPTQHDDGDERLAGDLLVGAAAIRAYLIFLGTPEEGTADPYYLKRSGWPIGNTANGGGKLIACKRRLLQSHLEDFARSHRRLNRSRPVVRRRKSAGIPGTVAAPSAANAGAADRE